MIGGMTTGALTIRALVRWKLCAAEQMGQHPITPPSRVGSAGFPPLVEIGDKTPIFGETKSL